MKKDSIFSSLKLLGLHFNEASFKRHGVKQDGDELSFGVNAEVSQEESGKEIYKVSLLVSCLKKNEYEVRVEIEGIFSLAGEAIVIKENLLKINAVSILMPYVRSEISLLTAQPNVDCIVLPAFNIAKMMESGSEDTLDDNAIK